VKGRIGRDQGLGGDQNADMSDDGDAARYAAAAAALLMDLREQHVAEGRGSAGLGDAGDRLANELLLELLAEQHADDAVLSEESADDARRLDADRVWIIDPLDGTREFSEPDRSDWAVHVALWERGDGVRAAAVALPALHQVFGTATAPVVPARGDRRLRVVVSRSRPPASARRVAAALDAELVTLGSAGAKTMAVVSGEVDAYLHAGGQYEWDSAAPTAVARAAGLHVSRLDGSALVYNRPDPWLPDLLVCRPELTDAILAVR
jgi:3'(2'), 5'-bisphosphate nucleotidase